MNFFNGSFVVHLYDYMGKTRVFLFLSHYLCCQKGCSSETMAFALKIVAVGSTAATQPFERVHQKNLRSLPAVLLSIEGHSIDGITISHAKNCSHDIGELSAFHP